MTEKKHRRIRSSTDWEFHKFIHFSENQPSFSKDSKSSSFVGTVENTQKIIDSCKKLTENKEIIIDDLSAAIEDTSPILPRTLMSQKPFIGFSPQFNLHTKKYLFCEPTQNNQNVEKILEKPQYLLNLNQIDEENDCSPAKIPRAHSQKSSTSTNPVVYANTTLQKCGTSSKHSSMSSRNNIPAEKARKSSEFSCQGINLMDFGSNKSPNLVYLNLKKNSHMPSTVANTTKKIPANNIQNTVPKHRRYHSELIRSKTKQQELSTFAKANVISNKDEANVATQIIELEKILLGLQDKTNFLENENKSLKNKVEILTQQNDNMNQLLKKSDYKIKSLCETNAKLDSYFKKICDILGKKETHFVSGELFSLQTDSSAVMESPKGTSENLINKNIPPKTHSKEKQNNKMASIKPKIFEAISKKIASSNIAPGRNKSSK